MFIVLLFRSLLVLSLGFALPFVASAVVFPFHIFSKQLSWCSARLKRLPLKSRLNPRDISNEISFGDGVSLKYGIETVQGNYLGMERDVYNPDSFHRLYILVDGVVVGFETSSIKKASDLKRNTRIKDLEGDEFFSYHRRLEFTLAKNWAAVIKERLDGVKQGQRLQFQDITGAHRKGIFLRYGTLSSTGDETLLLRDETTGEETEILLSFVNLSSI